MAMASTFIPGLNPQNPHYIPGPPASPEVPRGSLPVRRGHERLSSSMIPGYTGFVPQAQFIFAKNCSRVWAEALNDFTQWSVGQRGQELPKEAKGKKDVEKDEEPKPEPELEAKEPELGQEAEQASPYSMDDGDPRKFFMPAFLCSPTGHCRNLDRCTQGADPRRIPNISLHFLGPILRTCAFYLIMGAMCQDISSSSGTHMGISPMMHWASPPSRSSSWYRYLDFKFPLLSSYLSHPFGRKRGGPEGGGGRHKEKWFGGRAPFLLIGVINK
ncbi:ciliary microtubule inner protein 2B isoform X3 [Halichoerus grypus]